MDLSSFEFSRWAPKHTCKLCNAIKYKIAVRRHPKSLISVSIESMYATFCCISIATLVVCCTCSSWDMATYKAWIATFLDVLSFNSLLRWTLSSFWLRLKKLRTESVGYPSVKIMWSYSFPRFDTIPVRVRRTDRQDMPTVWRYNSSYVACYANALLKIPWRTWPAGILIRERWKCRTEKWETGNCRTWKMNDHEGLRMDGSVRNSECIKDCWRDVILKCTRG